MSFAYVVCLWSCWNSGYELDIVATTRSNRVRQSFSFISFSLSTELLEDKQWFKLVGVDTSPSYLLFQTLLPLFWTLICMIWMELTWTDAVFSRIALVLFWYVSVVSTFPNSFALVLDSNLHDLNGTNLDWRCFQQNCLGVIFVQKSKFSKHPENLRGAVLENIKNICAKFHLRGWGGAVLENIKNICAKFHLRGWASGPQAPAPPPPPWWRWAGLWGPQAPAAPNSSSISCLSSQKK